MSSEPVISEPQQRGELSDMSAHGFPEQGGFIAISASSWSHNRPNRQPPFRHLCCAGQVLLCAGQVSHYIWLVTGVCGELGCGQNGYR